MRVHLPLLAAFALGLNSGAFGQLVINEFQADPASDLSGDANGDGTRDGSADEFIELVNVSGGILDLSNWTVEDAANGGTVRHTFAAPTILPVDGVAVVFGGGTPTGTFGGANVQTANGSQNILGLNNGGDTISIYNGDKVLVTSITYGGEASSDQALTRDPDLTGEFVTHATADGANGILFSPGTRIDGSTFGSAQETLTVELSAESIAEDAGAGAASVTVTRSGPTDSALDLNLTSSDESEVLISEIAVQIPVGEASATFAVIDAVDDVLVDGDQTVQIGATAIGFARGEADLVVTDAGDRYSLVINELHIGLDPEFGDANGDGAINFDDEFVEILNVTGAVIDLSGMTVTDSRGPVHVFADGTTLEPDCAIVVFGGGNFFAGTVAGEFGNAQVQKSSLDGLSLNDGGDVIGLVNFEGQLIYEIETPDLSGNPGPGSLNLVIDGDASSGYGRHVDLSNEPLELFSPGTTFEGVAYCPAPAASLTLSVVPGSIMENSVGSATATIGIPTALGSDLEVFLESGDPGEALPQFSIATIPAGLRIAEIPIDSPDDLEADETQTVTLSASANGYLNATTTLEVTDDGDTPTFTELVINEVDSDNPGTDTAEFVELYNKTDEAQSLDGLVLVLINGNGDRVYNAFDLSGSIIPANGYFVVGSSVVPNVDLTPPTFPSDNAIQNGPDAVALYIGSLGDFPGNTGVAAIPNTLVDAVVYGTGDPDDAALLEALTPGEVQVDENGNGNKDNESIQRSPDGGEPFDSASYAQSEPTPGTENGTPVAPVGPIELISVGLDFESEIVTLTARDLDPTVLYQLVVSEDLADPAGSNAWIPVGGSFLIGDFNVIEDPIDPTLFTITVGDPELDPASAPTRLYAVEYFVGP